jgi:hypothetical protein
LYISHVSRSTLAAAFFNWREREKAEKLYSIQLLFTAALIVLSVAIRLERFFMGKFQTQELNEQKILHFTQN